MKLAIKLTFVALIAGVLAMPLAASAQGPGPLYQGYGMSASQFGSFNNFLNRNPQIASDLSIHPRFVNDPKYLDSHPELAKYLANHPEVRREFKRDPIGFMSSQGNYGWQRGNRTGWYQGWHKNWYPNQRSNFNTFLGQHPGMAQDLAEHPNYVHDQDWLRRHPEAQQYFAKHPGVSQEFRANPHGWISPESYRHVPKKEQRREYRHEQRQQKHEQRQEHRHERQQQKHEQQQQRHEGQGPHGQPTH
jgi:hypothetical protein